MFKDIEWRTNMLHIAVPISLQSLISSSLNMVGVLMIGQLGETSVAAVGLANQIFFLLNLFLFGVSSGAGIFTAQFWGQRDVTSIRKVLGLALMTALGGALLFSVLAIGFPRAALSIYSRDPQVIAFGAHYLRIVGFGYLATAITFSFSTVLRSTGNVRVPMFVSSLALTLDVIITYVLIFGKLGVPAMGISGAGYGTLVARLFECGLMLVVTYANKLPAAARLRELVAANRAFVLRFYKTALPVVFNETLWSLGVTTYNVVYARIGTEAIAAVNISGTIEQLAFVVFFGISNATSIMIGNKIGAGEEDKAMIYARRGLTLAMGLGIMMGIALATLSSSILTLYKISEEARLYAHYVLLVMGGVLWVKVSNLTIIVGILRSGGDTRFSLALDIGSVWLVGIPMALIGAFVLHLPVYFVVLMIMTEEIAKLAVGLWRFRSRRWVNNLVRKMAEA